MLYCITTADANEVASGDLDVFLSSLDRATATAIIVLRDVDDVTAEVYRSHPVAGAVLRSPQAGVSKVRNIGLRYLFGVGIDASDFVSFPDDDCRYPDGLVASLNKFVADYDADLVVGSYGERPVAEQPPKPLNRATALLRTSSVTVFARWDLILRTGGFNECLGVGSNGVQYGEDNDYAARLFDAAFRKYHLPSLRVWHLEQREMLGRNRKGYLTTCALNLRSLTAARMLAFGIIKSPLQDLLSRDRSLTHCRKALLALNLSLLKRAGEGRSEAKRLFEF